MTKQEKSPARWLEKDRERHLYAGDDVEAAKANGWAEPKFNKSNGEPWNPEPEDGEASQADAQALVGAGLNEVKARRAEKADKAAAAARKAAGDPVVAPPKADMRVEIVEPVKPKK